MRAAVYSENGAAREVLRVVDLPTPEPNRGEVRVRLVCSGVNPSDVKTRLGLRAPMAHPLIIPHSDGAGVIDAVGDGVSRSRIGQRVWTWNGQWGRAFGTAAEYVILPENQAVPLPEVIDFAAGACLGIPALTAYHAVTMAGGVEGKTVLIAGGAGSVGHYAVQFARLKGATQVIASVSGAEKAALSRAAGADEVVNYKQEDLVARIGALTGGRGVDRVVEVDLAANLTADLALIAADGDIVPYGSGAAQIPIPFFPAIVKNVSFRFFIVYNLAPPDRIRAIEDLTSLMEQGRLSHNIASRFPLASIAQAHEAVEQGTAIGNVIVEL
jgi:NADPH2:quinone reductase